MARLQKRLLFIMAISMLVIILGACGAKSEEGAVKKISEKAADMNGYKAKMEMTMKTGKADRQYDVDVWYKKDKTDFYRVALDNKSEEDGQIILKNDEGVFILTPELKKSFKFQTDWPENNSQPYLYQSLVKDVATDKNATFTAEEEEYVFVTQTNYQHNSHLPLQEIHFDKKTLLPNSVQVMNEEREVLITVQFNEVDMEPSFAKEDFERKAILDSAVADTSVDAESDEEQQALEVLFPQETNGLELTEKKAVDTENGERVIMTYKGDQHFTLIQEKDNTVPTTQMEQTGEKNGELVNLGHSIGALHDQSLEWEYKGTSYLLASDDMTAEELVAVASSVQGKEIK